MSERIAPGVRAQLAEEIAAAGGREVSFVAQVDRDGVITASEHDEGSSNLFDRMDSNGDGSLSFEEMQAPPQKPATGQQR